MTLSITRNEELHCCLDGVWNRLFLFCWCSENCFSESAKTFLLLLILICKICVIYKVLFHIRWCRFINIYLGGIAACSLHFTLFNTSVFLTTVRQYLLPTVYVVRRKVMFWHVSIRPSICLSTPRGVPRPGPARGGYPGQVQPGILGGGVPWWGVLHLGYSPSDLARGVL